MIDRLTMVDVFTVTAMLSCEAMSRSACCNRFHPVTTLSTFQKQVRFAP